MPGFYFDPAYMIWIAPAMLLAMWAQWRVHSAFAAASREPAALTALRRPSPFALPLAILPSLSMASSLASEIVRVSGFCV
jgi:hypothetical protein